jgi:hypothetical protein
VYQGDLRTEITELGQRQQALMEQHTALHTDVSEIHNMLERLCREGGHPTWHAAKGDAPGQSRAPISCVVSLSS